LEDFKKLNVNNWLEKNWWLLLVGAVLGFIIFKFFQPSIMSVVQTQSVVPAAASASPEILAGIISASGSVVAAIIGGKK